jgi:hypothetical protein
MEKSISATGALFCIASMALRVCSYVPYEAVGGDEEVVVDGPIDTEYIVQEVGNTASSKKVEGGVQKQKTDNGVTGGPGKKGGQVLENGLRGK